MHEYWYRQTLHKPLYADMLWSRPENRAYAGKLLVCGGSAQGFAAPAEAYRQAGKAGAGSVRLLLPDSLRRYVGKTFEAGDFAPTTPSGSFSQKALGELLPVAAWADGALLAGDFGRNSETAILLEKFAAKYTGQLTFCGDAVDYFLAVPQSLLRRPNTLLALNFNQLQKLAVGAHYPRAFTSGLDLLHFVETLHGFSSEHQAYLLIHHLEQIFIAVDGRIVSVPQGGLPASPLHSAVRAAVWWLQNPQKSFQALAISLVADQV